MYKMAVGFMLAHPYGFTRVMSSYRWNRNFQNGKVSLGVVQSIFSHRKKCGSVLISYAFIAFGIIIKCSFMAVF